MDLCEFKASVVYRVSFRTAKTVSQRNPVSKKLKVKLRQKSITRALF